MKTKSILLCFVFALFANMHTANAQVNVHDSLALVDLYNSTNGPGWYHYRNWLKANPVSTWHGVTVTGSRVTKIDLIDNGLIGSIPSSIGHLDSLYYLELSQNRLSDTIPSSIVNLKKLFFVGLQHNYFTFNGMELIAQKFPYAIYSPQANIPVHQKGSTLSVNAGGTLSNNTYKWYKSDVADTILVKIIKGDSTFPPSDSGTYRVVVTNEVATQLKLATPWYNYTAPLECCVAPVPVHPNGLSCGPPYPCVGLEALPWQRVKKAGCTTPVKYEVEWRAVGKSLWSDTFVTIKNPDAKYGVTIVGPQRCYGCGKPGCVCVVTYEWRVRGICSDTNKTAWVAGLPYTLTGRWYPYPVATSSNTATSSASAASSQDKFTIAAYPNPVAGELKLSGNLKAGGPINIQIINSVGQTVLRRDYNFNTGNFNAGIDVSKLPPGVYLVVVNDKTERATLTVLKQ